MENRKSLKEFSLGTDSQFILKIKERNANRNQLRTYKRLAIDVLLKLDEKGWSQKKLAEELEVSAQYVSKLLKGKEKFGGDILCKLENILDMPIFIQNLPRSKQELLKYETEIQQVYKKEFETPVIPLFTVDIEIEQLAEM